MPIYSFGEDSPMKFQVSDKTARRYNQAVDQFFKAQQRFNQKFGRRWDPKADPILINWSRRQKHAWNSFANIYKDVLETRGPFHENDLMDDFLVKNPAGKIGDQVSTGVGNTLGGMVRFAPVASEKWGRIICTTAAIGAAYGLLRGLQGYYCGHK